MKLRESFESVYINKIRLDSLNQGTLFVTVIRVKVWCAVYKKLTIYC